MNGLAAAREALEGKRRRGRSARIKVGRAELARERSDHPPRPPIERMRQSVPGFARVLKGAPLCPTREAEQHDGSRRRLAGRCADLTGLRMKGTAHRETARGAAPTQLIEFEHAEA
jgi:hypothetical protein